MRLLTLNLLLLFHFVTSQFFSPIKTPVCVVGGGPSGITIGRLLKQNNIGYQIFESKPYVGGKAHTWRDRSNNKVETGALFFTLRSTFITDTVKEAGLQLKRFNGTAVSIYNQNGYTFSYQNPTTPEGQKQFTDAVAKYTKLRNTYNLTVGYVNLPTELSVSLLEWLKINGLEVLIPMFIPIITIQGFGPLDEIPVIYVLKLLDIAGLTSLTDFINNLWTVEAGLDVLWSTHAKKLNMNLNHHVTYIKRFRSFNGEQLNLLVFQNPTQKPVLCNYVVLANPPYLAKLRSMYSDMDFNEIDILSKIRYHHYISSIIDTSNWLPNVLFNSISNNFTYPYEPKGTGETVGFLKQDKYYSAYSWVSGAYPAPSNYLTTTKITIDQLGLLLRLDSQKAVKNQARILEQFNWEYFPHIQSNFIRQGWFNRFDRLQGFKNTFYASGLMSFETMNEAIEMSQHLFKTKILPRFR